MTDREILVRFTADARPAMEALERVAAKLAEPWRALARAFMRGGTPTAEDRLYARRANRALARSRRNQPPAPGPRCETCQDEGECMDGVLYPTGHVEVWGACFDCDGRPRRVRRASASRKRRPHGRPR